MLKKHTLFALVSGLSIAFIGVVMTYKTSAPLLNLKGYREDGTLEFSRSKGETTQVERDSKYVTITSAETSRGNKFYCLSETSASWNINSETNKNYIGYCARNDVTYFSSSTSGTNHEVFEAINSISIVLNTSNSRSFNIYTSNDGTNWSDPIAFATTPSSPTYTFSSSVRSVKIEYNSNFTQYIKSISLTYSCENGLPENLESIRVEDPKTEYFVGSTFVEPTVIAVYDSGREKVVSGAVFTGFDSSSAVASQTINVSYTEGIEVHTSYTVEIKTAVVDDLIGTFNHSYFSLTFNNDLTGCETYGSYHVYFEWSHVGSLITLTYSHGDDLTNFSSYRLFASETTPNTSATLNGTQLKISTYYSDGSEYPLQRTLNKA